MNTLETMPDTLTASANQKAGELDSGSLTAESLASSKNILRPTRSGKTTGLQQFFTTPEVAAFIASVLDPEQKYHVLDLTAGDGSLLAPYDPAKRVGVEIDADQIRAAKKDGRGYAALQGDVQHLFPLMQLAGLEQFSRIALNPPFGLDWQAGTVNGGKPGNSAKITLQMALKLLATDGQGAMIAGKGRIERDILTDPDLARAIYAVVDITGAFPGVSLPTAIVFFASPASRRNKPPASVAVPPTTEAVIAARDSQFPFLCSYDFTEAQDLKDALHAVQDEHTRRLAQRIGKAAADIVLDTKGRISVRLSPLTVKSIMAEVSPGAVAAINRLHGNRVNYFALNSREWNAVEALADAGHLTIEDKTRTAVKAVMDKAAALSCPVYPIKPQQRLGYLADADKIPCTKSDSSRGFIAGHSYAVTCSSRIKRSTRKEVKEVEGRNGKEIKELLWTRAAKVLDIALTPEAGFTPVALTEEPADIGYLIEHFSLPDPGDLATQFPAAMETRRETLRQMEVDTLAPRGLALKEYQREDIARLLIKQGGILSWEQGLGKSMGAMTFAEACYRRSETDGNALFIVPQDLIPQWQAEAKKFFGRELVWIRTRAEAREIARGIKAEQRQVKFDPFYDKQSAWYVTHYEALSIGGTTGKVTVGSGEYQQTLKTEQGKAILPSMAVRTKTIKKVIPQGYRQGEWHNAETLVYEATLTSEALCPECWQRNNVETDTDSGWDGTTCKVCGYAHKALHLKSLAHELTTAFIQGVIVVDEGTKIKGDSLQSLAVRGLRARRKLILTGTPIKNYVLDLFHLLGWGLGYNSPRFPFAYEGGKDKFKKDFCVVETLGGRSGREKILPEVTNLSILWKMLSGSIVRRRKEDTGETLVPRTFVPVTVPLGTEQRRQYLRWLNDFDRWYCDMNPSANPAMVEMNSAILGQLHKLEYATTLPTADPDATYWGVPVDDMTPKTLKVLEIAALHAARGEKVLIGSDVMLTGRMIADSLNSKGIPAAHILEESKSGNVQTKNPASRAGVVAKFREGDTRVLCAGVQSINLGHNLDFASVVILDGLCWDFATLDQFLARVHRLTSKRPVTVYVVLADGSLDERKWHLLQEKGKSAELALDGELTEKDQKVINLQEIVRDLQRRGLPAPATVAESDCRALWESQTFSLRPLGSPIETAMEENVTRKEEPKTETMPLFHFQAIVPKKNRNAPAIGSLYAPQVQQGQLFAL